MSGEYYHVVPTDDLLEHKTKGDTCDCQPMIKPEDLLIVHNAIDNREFDEIAEEINK
jgi:hypothetical protein